MNEPYNKVRGKKMKYSTMILFKQDFFENVNCLWIYSPGKKPKNEPQWKTSFRWENGVSISKFLFSILLNYHFKFTIASSLMISFGTNCSQIFQWKALPKTNIFFQWCFWQVWLSPPWYINIWENKKTPMTLFSSNIKFSKHNE